MICLSKCTALRFPTEITRLSRFLKIKNYNFYKAVEFGEYVMPILQEMQIKFSIPMHLGLAKITSPHTSVLPEILTLFKKPKSLISQKINDPVQKRTNTSHGRFSQDDTRGGQTLRVTSRQGSASQKHSEVPLHAD